MVNIPSDVQQFFDKILMCETGYELMSKLDIYGLNFDAVAKILKENGYRDEAAWLLQQKKTEAYVRFYGKDIKMGAFQVFNPFTGQHSRYETEDEARIALVDLSKQILEAHKPALVREISNEHGDSTWVSVELTSPVQIS